MIIDLHCDLLEYVASAPEHTFYDAASRCSLPFLREGEVSLQVCAAYTPTKPGSARSVLDQVSAFRSIDDSYIDVLKKNAKLSLSSERTALMLSFENASGLCEEGESLQLLEARLRAYADEFKIAYVGLVWNSNSRFGGTAGSKTGLTDDGKFLIDLLEDLSIPIDFSHSSDKLFFDVVDYTEAKRYKTLLIASHSNLRSKVIHPRNLTDEQVRILVKKGGVIGLNFVSYFLGKDFRKGLHNHITGMLELGAEDNLCLGSDFFSCWFYDKALPEDIDVFHKGFGTSRCLCELPSEMASYLSSDQITKIMSENAFKFFSKRFS